MMIRHECGKLFRVAEHAKFWVNCPRCHKNVHVDECGEGKKHVPAKNRKGDLM